MIRVPLRTGFYSKVNYNITYTAPICFGYFSWPGDATVMTHPTSRNEDLMLNIFIGVTWLLALTFKLLSPQSLRTALTCISTSLESHHTYCCKEMKNIFIPPPS